MGDMTAHFSRREFTCKCGCNLNNINETFVKKMENVYEYLEKTADGVAAIFINSGCRCPRHSLSVGGGYNDAHTVGIAADFHALKADGINYWSAYELAAVCEKLGFSGIGIITEKDLHADIRNKDNYVNDHWFGNEITGDNYVKTFKEYLPPIKETTTTKKHKIAVYIDGVLSFEREV